MSKNSGFDLDCCRYCVKQKQELPFTKIATKIVKDEGSEIHWPIFWATEIGQFLI